MRGLTNAGVARSAIIATGFVLALVAFVAAYLYELVFWRRSRRAEAAEADYTAGERATEADLTAGGHPVPPMDAPHYHGHHHRRYHSESDGQRDEEVTGV